MASIKYVPLGDPRYDEIASMIYRSYSNACILWVEEVENPKLEERYHKYKTALQEKHGDICKEHLLFHGTKELYINPIISNGFDHTCNVTSAYGKGSYFAKEANYSKDYSHTINREQVSYMIMTSVVCAKPCLGKCNAVIDTEKYDYAVNSLESPTIYVIPHDAAALPKYVVAFYKYAS